MAFKIYSVEDDKDISRIINLTLSKQGYLVKSFFNGQDFFKGIEIEKPDLILLDMMLPDLSGGEIIKKIRNNRAFDDIDIIIISANRMIMDKVDGLDLGADDYIEKPFDLLELISRCNAHLRRKKSNQNISFGAFEMDLNMHLVKYNENELNLTIKEYEILKILLLQKGAIVSRDELLSSIWGEEALETRTIDMHIKSIRKKINDKEGKIIQTVYGIGYRICS